MNSFVQYARHYAHAALLFFFVAIALHSWQSYCIIDLTQAVNREPTCNPNDIRILNFVTATSFSISAVFVLLFVLCYFKKAMN